ncbi:MAG: peptidoglycan-binding protein [Leptolyngbyaceae cyanobacterium bins.59]|nr:peptidoglycan-binding protein [Leptolyngbyaceae cyanobacterium bins.59]
MESLAYLHSALVYEAACASEVSSSGPSGPLPNSPKERSDSRQGRSRYNWVCYSVALLVGLVQMEGALALRRGDRGAAVIDLQTTLKNQGYFRGPVTGVYGPMTEAAVRQFQTTRQLKVDGVAGAQTLSTLQGNSISQQGNPVSGVPLANSVPANSVGTDAIVSATPLKTALRSGSRGDAVINLQKQLMQLNYYSGPITGIFGPKTEESVKRFQASQGLVVDGIAGTKTTLALQTLGTSPTQSVTNNLAGGGTPPTANSAVTSTPNSQPPVPETNTLEVLQPGDNGAAVTALQIRLQKVGDYQGPIDGFYSVQMAEAVREFQSRHNIPADGIAGPRTQKAIFSDSPESLSQGPVTSNANVEDTTAQADNPQWVVSGQVISQVGSLIPNPSQSNPTQTTTTLDLLTLQQRLQASGFYQGPLDGKIGPQTRAAIRNAQDYYGISEAQVWSGQF